MSARWCVPFAVCLLAVAFHGAVMQARRALSMSVLLGRDQGSGDEIPAATAMIMQGADGRIHEPKDVEGTSDPSNDQVIDEVEDTIETSKNVIQWRTPRGDLTFVNGRLNLKNAFYAEIKQAATNVDNLKAAFQDVVEHADPSHVNTLKNRSSSEGDVNRLRRRSCEKLEQMGSLGGGTKETPPGGGLAFSKILQTCSKMLDVSTNGVDFIGQTLPVIIAEISQYLPAALSTVSSAVSVFGPVMTLLGVVGEYLEFQRMSRKMVLQTNEVVTPLIFKAECLLRQLRMDGFETGTLRLQPSVWRDVCREEQAQNILIEHIKVSFANLQYALQVLLTIGSCLYPDQARVKVKARCVKAMYEDFSLGGKIGMGVLFQFTSMVVLHNSGLDELLEFQSESVWHPGPGYNSAAMFHPNAKFPNRMPELQKEAAEGDLKRRAVCNRILVEQQAYASMLSVLGNAMETWMRTFARDFKELSPHAVTTRALHPCRAVFGQIGEGFKFCKVPIAPAVADLRAQDDNKVCGLAFTLWKM